MCVDHHCVLTATTTSPQEFDRPNSAYMLIYERVTVPTSTPSPAQASPGGGLLQGLSLASPGKGLSPPLPYDMAPVLFHVRCHWFPVSMSSFCETWSCLLLWSLGNQLFSPCALPQAVMLSNITNVEQQHLLHRDYFSLVLGMLEASVPGGQGRAKIRCALVAEVLCCG